MSIQSSPSFFPIDQLPFELFTKIVSYLDFHSIDLLMCTSKQMKAAALTAFKVCELSRLHLFTGLLAKRFPILKEPLKSLHLSIQGENLLEIQQALLQRQSDLLKVMTPLQEGALLHLSSTPLPLLLKNFILLMRVRLATCQTLRFDNPLKNDQLLTQADWCADFGDINQACELASWLPLTHERTACILRICKKTRTPQFYPKLIELADTVDCPSEAFAYICLALSDTGESLKALELSDKIKDPDEKTAIWQKICKDLARDQKFDESFSLFAALDGPQENLLVDLTEQLAHHGQFDLALAQLPSFVDPKCRASAVCKIASEMALHGRLEDSRELIRSLEDPSYQQQALLLYGQALIYHHQWPEAYALALTLPSQDKDKLLYTLSQKEAQKGALEQVFINLKQMQDDRHCQELIKWLIYFLIKYETLDLALHLASEHLLGSALYHALRKICEKCIQQQPIEKVLWLTKQIEDPLHYQITLNKIALLLMEACRWEEVETVILAMPSPTRAQARLNQVKCLLKRRLPEK